MGVGGLGQDGLDEAILVIAQYPDGTYYWYALLAAPDGFASQSGDPPTIIVVSPATPPATPQMNVLPTDVQQVLVLGSVGIFAGPSGLSSQVGTTVRGQTFAVLGVSADGQWWAIPCPATPGTCWISANPTFVRPVSGSQPVVTATATVVYPTPTRRPPTPVPPTPVPQPERIQFAPGQEHAVRSGPLWANTVRQFVFYAAAGQTPTVRFNSPSPAASFWIVGAQDGVIYKPQGNPSRDFTFVAPRSQDYLISMVAPVNTSFSLELIIPRPGPTPAPTLQPTVQPTVPAQPERISFGPGQTSAVRSGTLPSGSDKQYVFRAQAGQVARILLGRPAGSDANFSVRGVSDGVVYKPLSDPAREWAFQLPRTQDYLITIAASGATSYTLELTIPPLGPTPTVVPPPPAERISFAPGQDSATRSGPLAASQYKRYVFGGLQGQTATIVVSSPSPSTYFTVVGVSDGIPYKSQGSSAMSFTFTLPLTQDYMISIGSSVNTSYTLVLTIPPLIGPSPTATPTSTPTTGPTGTPTATPTARLL